VPRADVVAVIPAFQAEATVAAVTRGLREYLERVIVVDDGSSDATGAAARAVGATVARLARNGGKGAALRRGIEIALESAPDALVLVDADGQHDPADLPAFLERWDGSRPDLLIGARLADRAAIPAVRFWTNYVGTRVLSWMTGLELEDSQSGYRLLSASLARRLRLQSDDYAVESEMLIKAARLGARVDHVRVATIYNGAGSHFRPLLDTYRISRASIYFKVFDDAGGA
jgi:glycosyltransferase involved in cell wall biosynthesis